MSKPTVAAPGGPNDTPATSRRRQREQATEVTPAVDPKAPAADPVSLGVMFGQGGRVTIGGKSYEIAPFPLSKHQDAQELLSLWPNLLFIAGLVDAGDGDDILNAEKVAESFNGVYAAADSDSRMTTEGVYTGMAHLATTLDETTINAMADFIVLALQRRSPDVRREDILDELDIPTALQILRFILATNSGMKSRFQTP